MASADPWVGLRSGRASRYWRGIDQIDQRLSQKVEAYNGARYGLGRIEQDQEVTHHDLGVARGDLAAQKMLAAPLVSLFTADQGNTTLDVLLGSKSLDDLVGSIDTVNRVSDQDAQVLTEVISFRSSVPRRSTSSPASTPSRAGRREPRRREGEHRGPARAAKRLPLVDPGRDRAVRAGKRGAAQARDGARADRLGPAGQPAARRRRAVAGRRERRPGLTVGGVVGIAIRSSAPPTSGRARAPRASTAPAPRCTSLQVGVSLPHYTGAQWAMGVPVAYNQLQPATSSSFRPAAATSASTSAAASSSIRRTPAMSSKISSLSEAYSPAVTSALAAFCAATRRQRVDLGGEVLLHDLPLQLQGRRDLARLRREVARQDAEALDLLVPREVGVRLVDDSLDPLAGCRGSPRALSSSVISAAT